VSTNELDNLVQGIEEKEMSPARIFCKNLFKNKAAIIGLSIILFLLLCAIFAPLITSYEYDEQELKNMLQSPSREHLFGTDEFGRDLFTRVIYGTRVSLQIGFIAVGISMIIGVVLGAIAGYYGGIIDHVISGITDIAWAFPTTLLAIAIMATLGPSLFNVLISVALVYWSGYARLVRGQFLSLKEQEFIEAARALGYSNLRIIFRHILPNAIAPVIVLTTLSIPQAIIVESSLSFLGLGAQPPTPSWGSIMNSGRAYLLEAPWVALFPGLMIALIVLGFNLFGDSLRDTLDPRLRD
jgi:peptide/nickel transport system permease protein